MLLLFVVQDCGDCNKILTSHSGIVSHLDRRNRPFMRFTLEKPECGASMVIVTVTTHIGTYSL
jgi:hypothetical protein